MGTLRSPQCGSGHLKGERSVSHVLFPEGPGCSDGEQTRWCTSGHRITHLDSPSLAGQALIGGCHPAPLRPTMAFPLMRRPAIAGAGGDISPSPKAASALGLARERLNLNAIGFPQNVITTIQNARASSTRSLYDCKCACLRTGVQGYRKCLSSVRCL